MSAMPRLHVVVAHSRYRLRGGEDAVVEAEVDLLRRFGHHVTVISRDNEDVEERSSLRLLKTAVWSSDTTRELREIHAARPVDIVHVHNTLPLVSPSVFWGAEALGIPSVQTVHNFRLACPQAMFLRDGRVCEDCVGRVPWRGVVRACYRGSHAASAAVAGVITLHRGLGTWTRKVTRYIALNAFCRDKLIETGLPAHRIRIKPNFVESDAGPTNLTGQRQGFLFVGRLSEEKGVRTLAEACRDLPPAVLKVAGTGPMEDDLRAQLPAGSLLGQLGQSEVARIMGDSMALVLPSIWYENFPRTLVEAFAAGLPVIASRIGALASLVQHGVNGLLFEPGDAADLERQLRWAMAHPQAMAEMGRHARAHFEAEFGPERNHELLMDIYRDAIAEMSRPASRGIGGPAIDPAPQGRGPGR